LDKTKASHKIDVVVALSMAALAAVRGQNESHYDRCSAEWEAAWGTAGDLDAPPAEQRSSEAQRRRIATEIRAAGELDGTRISISQMTRLRTDESMLHVDRYA
jgi:hypothetical protein